MGDVCLLVFLFFILFRGITLKFAASPISVSGRDIGPGKAVVQVLDTDLDKRHSKVCRHLSHPASE